MSDWRWQNVSREEATCHCGCGLVASPEWLDWLQDLRDQVGFPLPFRSIVRCPAHNKAIGGSSTSVYLLSAEPGPYGGADIGIKPRSKAQGGAPDRVYRIVKAALAQGFNNVEICDGHIHIGHIPLGHPQFECVYWGRSR